MPSHDIISAWCANFVYFSLASVHGLYLVCEYGHAPYPARLSFNGIAPVLHIEESQHAPERNIMIIIDILCCMVYNRMCCLVCCCLSSTRLCTPSCLPLQSSVCLLHKVLCPDGASTHCPWHSPTPVVIIIWFLDVHLSQGPPILHAARNCLGLPYSCGR